MRGDVRIMCVCQNSQGFEVLHFTEGIRLDGAYSIVSQVPIGTIYVVSLKIYIYITVIHCTTGFNQPSDFYLRWKYRSV